MVPLVRRSASRARGSLATSKVLFGQVPPRPLPRREPRKAARAAASGVPMVRHRVPAQPGEQRLLFKAVLRRRLQGSSPTAGAREAAGDGADVRGVRRHVPFTADRSLLLFEALQRHPAQAAREGEGLSRFACWRVGCASLRAISA